MLVANVFFLVACARRRWRTSRQRRACPPRPPSLSCPVSWLWWTCWCSQAPSTSVRLRPRRTCPPVAWCVSASGLVRSYLCRREHQSVQWNGNTITISFCGGASFARHTGKFMSWKIPWQYSLHTLIIPLISSLIGKANSFANCVPNWGMCRVFRVRNYAIITLEFLTCRENNFQWSSLPLWVFECICVYNIDLMSFIWMQSRWLLYYN